MAILVASLILFGVFAFYNMTPVVVHLGSGHSAEMPLAEVVAAALGAGALSVLLITGVREVRRMLGGFRERISRRRRTRAEDLYQRGVDAHLSGRLPLAVELLSESQRKDPTYLQPLYRLGRLYREMGRFDEALATHLKARAVSARNLRTLLHLSEDYEAMGRFPEAVGVLREILARDDGNRTALRSLRNLLERTGDWEGAVDAQRRLLRLVGKKDTRERAALHGQVCRYALRFMEKGEPGNAARFLKVVLREDPLFIPARVALGVAEIARGETEAGVQLLVKGYRETGNPVFLEELEEQLIGLENPEELIRLHRALAAQRPGDILLALFFGKACLRLEMVDEARASLRRVESSGYDAPLLHALLGQAFQKRERYEEGCEELSRALALTPCQGPLYRCSDCGHTEPAWLDRCPSCQSWNTFCVPLPEEVYSLPSAPRYEGMA